MEDINLFIANAGHLLDNNMAAIKRAFERAQKSVSEALRLNEVDVVCIADKYRVIPETGMSGFTPNRHLVYLYVDAAKTLDEDELYATLCHEFAHVKRYEASGYGETLLDSIIFEGLAVAFEEEMPSGQGTFFVNYMKSNNNAPLSEKIKKHFGDRQFSHFHWFIEESDELPRWTGYRVGYYLVTQYMEKTGKKASELLVEDTAKFRL